MFLSKQNKTAITYGHQKISYSQFHSAVWEYSKVIAISKGDRVVVFGENRPGWMVGFYSVWNSNGIVVPIDFLSAATDVAYILNDSKPKYAFVSNNSAELFHEACAISGQSPEIISIESLEKFEGLNDETVTIQPDLEQTAVLIYTSGTTGSPKGVMLSFQNIYFNLKAVCEDIPILVEHQRIMVLLPLHHIFLLVGTLVAPFYSGAEVAISPSMVSEDIIKTLQENNITVLIGVPRLFAGIHKGIFDKINASFVARMLLALARKFKSRALSKTIFGAVHKKFGGHIQYFISGGAALDKAIATDYQTIGFEVLEGYGMTEAAPMITFSKPGRVKPGSPGEIVANGEVKIVDGEITFKGMNVMQGYYQKPDDTKEVIKDGWLYTGDLGFFEDGYLYITGRKKEIIVLSNGKNINPSEIETELMNISPIISEVGVFQDKDQLHALFVLDQNKIIDLVDEETFIRQTVLHEYNRKVTPYKKVTRFTITTNDLPKTRLGKLKRFELSGIAKKGNTAFKNSNSQPTPDFEEYNIIKDYLSKEKQVTVYPLDHLEYDLGLDSLDKVSFQVFINQTFGVELDTDSIIKFGSVLQLAKFIEENRLRIQIEKINWTEILREKINFKMPRTWVTSTLISKTTKWAFQLYFRFRSSGIENVPDGPCILAANHQSFFDGLFVTAFLRSKQVRKTYFYAKEKHVKTRLLKFFAGRNNIIVMDINKDLKESIQKMAEVLRHQKYLVIFPEGTRSKSGKLGDFKKTFAILSRELNVPIVPICIRGAIDALPKGSLFPRPFTKICVEYLKPVYPENLSYDMLTQVVQKRIENSQAKCAS